MRVTVRGVIYGRVARLSLGTSSKVDRRTPTRAQHVIDRSIKQPTSLYTGGRQPAKFEHLLKLKKNFSPVMLEDPKSALLR